MAKVIAKAAKGKEFLYDYTTAHAVSARSAVAIRDALNANNYTLSSDTVIWHIFDIDDYDMAAEYAKRQKFYIYKGHIYRKFR